MASINLGCSPYQEVRSPIIRRSVMSESARSRLPSEVRRKVSPVTRERAGRALDALIGYNSLQQMAGAAMAVGTDIRSRCSFPRQSAGMPSTAPAQRRGRSCISIRVVWACGSRTPVSSRAPRRSSLDPSGPDRSRSCRNQERVRRPACSRSRNRFGRGTAGP